MLFRRKLLLNLYKLSDVCILMVSLLLASWFVTSHMKKISLEEFFLLRIEIVNLIIFLGVIILWGILFHHFHLYRSRRLGRRIQECKDIVKATTAGTVIMLVCGQICKISAFTPHFMLAFWFSSTMLTICFRLFIRYFLKKVRLHGRNLRNILIVGTNQRAYDFARKIEESKELGYCVIGYVDDKIYLPREDLNLLGKLGDFPAILKGHIIDEVVVALPIKSKYKEIQRIIETAEEQGILIRLNLFQLFNTRIAESTSGIFEDFSVLKMVSGSQDSCRYVAKRTVDIVLTSVLIVLTFPLMLVSAIAIKLTSYGPVFFFQDRVGYNKRIFRLCKFRTMVVDAEKRQEQLEALNEMDGPVFKIRNDPRVTSVGRWLRKSSMDELPQLFNVLKDDMSLVGPRPLPVRDYNGFSQDWQRRRFSIKPGITCTWQISGRNNISFEEWMKLDMEYIDNWSLIGDLKILFKTIPVVICGKGAI